ncbi:hypothetical protein [Streptomyces sp. NPDC056010]|uniref:hypothetical protein n=1 Tax=Streptomyces sp. NPDC056010 TaxID=3345679 RepID=UPI0035D8163A
MSELNSDETVAADPGWLHDNARLCQVSTKRLSAEKKRPGQVSQWDISLKRSFGFSKDHLHIGLACIATGEGKSGKPIGRVEAEVVGNYRIGDDHPKILPKDAVSFGNEVGIRDTFPYLRQAMDLMAMQIGLGRVKLDPPEPRMSIVNHEAHQDHE